MNDAVRLHNSNVIETVTPSSCALPEYFILYRFPSLSNPNSTAVLIHCTQAQGYTVPVWNMELVNNPLESIGPSLPIRCDDTLLNNESHTIFIERFSRRIEEHKKLYHTCIKYYGLSVRKGNGTLIPVMNLLHSCRVLPSRFTRIQDYPSYSFNTVEDVLMEPQSLIELREMAHLVSQTADQNTIEHRIARDILISLHENGTREVTLVPNKDVTKIPQHIVNSYIEGLVEKKESCPITMNPLEKLTTCLTQCGHALDMPSAKCWISSEHSCPVCRQPCSLETLQSWS
jgi:hypothetical protein